jgi:hypothetical protein
MATAVTVHTRTAASRASAAFLLLLATNFALAHQPRLRETEDTIAVTQPEVSKAFYARLNGRPQYYRIDSDRQFRLYVQTVVPDEDSIDTDYDIVVTRGSDTVIARRGRFADWTPYYEPFGGDRYLRGPDGHQVVPAGSYLIEVSSGDNRGRYALVVGEGEAWPLREIANAFRLMPGIKRRFFGKPGWRAWTAQPCPLRRTGQKRAGAAKAAPALLPFFYRWMTSFWVASTPGADILRR